MSRINKVAVIGSGVMGLGIAAHIANAHTEVLLLDVIDNTSNDRNAIVNNAIARINNPSSQALTSLNNIKYIQIGNLTDDLDKIKDADWVIEVIIEKLEIKRELYRRLEQICKRNAIISSNTSTIPLASLTENMSSNFKENFLITHFFNPPRYMRLLELVIGKHTKKEVIEQITDFIDYKLGKGIVRCKDSPGFIANRIGCYWLQISLNEAIKLGIDIVTADYLMTLFGIPKTGAFALMDLIGIDVLQLIINSLQQNLKDADDLQKIGIKHELISSMIQNGYIGRKGKGGFYRIKEIEGNKQKEAIDLISGKYNIVRPIDKEKWKGISLKDLLEGTSKESEYIRNVFVQFLSYTASLIPEIADDIFLVDEAMRLGYNWQFGPFEIIDKISDERENGSKWLKNKLLNNKVAIPDILHKINNQPYYMGEKYYDYLENNYKAIVKDPGTWSLREKKAKSPIISNESASLWDIGDNIVCFELKTKMNSFDWQAFELLMDAVKLVERDYQAMIIGGDLDIFSVGANLKFFLERVDKQLWDDISNFIKLGQQAFLDVKYCKVPVVAALPGIALGGGCELLLHASAVQAYIETTVGLVETKIGLTPGWGGCKEMLIRASVAKEISLKDAYLNIFESKTSKSAENLYNMFVINILDKITMNKARVLEDSKSLAIKLSNNYIPNTTCIIEPTITSQESLDIDISGFSEHEKLIHNLLVNIFISKHPRSEKQLLQEEHDSFMQLIKTKETREKIARTVKL